MKKVLFLALFIVVSCSKEPNYIQPDIIASEYYKNLLKGNSVDAYLLLSDEIKSKINIYEFEDLVHIDIGNEDSTSSISEYKDYSFTPFLSNSSVEVLSIDVDEMNANIDLVGEILDIQLIGQRILEKLMSDYLNSGIDIKEQSEALFIDEINSVGVENLPKKKLMPININLILQAGDGWKVDLNLEKLDSIKEKKDREKLELEMQIKELELEIEETERKIKERRENKAKIEAEKVKQLEKSKIEKENYIIEFIEFLEFEVTRIDTYLDKNLPAVRFAIQNQGNKIISRLELLVYFYDNNNLPIFEKKYVPVSEYDYKGYQTLKPNYIFRLDEGEYYTIDNLGSEWSGKATYEVVDIEFQE